MIDAMLTRPAPSDSVCKWCLECGVSAPAAQISEIYADEPPTPLCTECLEYLDEYVDC